VALHQNNVEARERYCLRALHYSKLSENPNSIVAALISLASTSYYGKHPQKAEQIYQKAHVHIEEIPPLQRARLLVELAVVSAQQGMERDALTYLEQAQKMYPEHPENDPSALYAEFTPVSMILEEGLTYLALAEHYPEKHSKHAWDAFLQIEEYQSQQDVPRRIFYEIINQQAATALVMRDQELFQDYLQRGVQGAILLNSNQRRQEASDVYKRAQVLWLGESKVAQLASLF
jgi:tetratricopeptide (TPR) repeat protein